MKDKGFTLVEMLAVITIIGLLALTTLEAMDIVNRKNKESAFEVQVDSILNSAISYVPTSQILLPTISKSSGCKSLIYNNVTDHTSETSDNLCEVKVSLQALYKEGVLSKEINNPKTGKPLVLSASYIVITYGKDSKAEEDLYEYDGLYLYRLEYK